MRPMIPDFADLPPMSPGQTDCILGIDPGLQRTGYAVVTATPGGFDARLVEAGVIRLDRSAPLPDRLVELTRTLTDLVAQHRPSVLVCEELYAHYRHPRTAILMGHARGVVLATAAAAGLEIIPVSATNVKKVLTGSGHASKRQMQLAVATTLRLAQVPEPHDVADAIAIALAGQRGRHARQAVGTRRRAQA